MKPLILLPFVLLLAGGFEKEALIRPDPLVMSDEAYGHFCMMNVAEHPGPKGQAFIKGRAEPYWFPSVRDLLTFRLLPGENAEITALYVSDTSASADYDKINPGAWVAAEKAFYVINSIQLGGMGLSEAVPFADEAKARDFASRKGGEGRSLDAIDRSWIFDQEEANS